MKYDGLNISVRKATPSSSIGSVFISQPTLLELQTKIIQLEQSGELPTSDNPYTLYLIDCIRNGVTKYHTKNIEIIQEFLGMPIDVIGSIHKWTCSEFCINVDEAKKQWEFDGLWYYIQLMGREHSLVELRYMVEHYEAALERFQ